MQNSRKIILAVSLLFSVVVAGILLALAPHLPVSQISQLTSQQTTSPSALQKAPALSENNNSPSINHTSQTSVPLDSEKASSITQYGITWTFDKPYPVGQFVNGDYYVVGPVVITGQVPSWDGTRNGAMVDPDASAEIGQGYDARAYNFNDSLRIKFPVTLSGTRSVISSIGLIDQKKGGAYDTLKAASVLTIVDTAPTPGTFRPPYVAGPKPLWNIAAVDYKRAPSLPVPAGTVIPDLVGAGILERVWLNHGPKTRGAEIHPVDNMPPYPRDSSLEESEMAVLAMLDTPQRVIAINRLIQLGIDTYQIALRNGDAFQANGGFGSGWKFPVIFAGIMLGDAAMQSPPAHTSPTGVEKFGEDGFTYYGQPTAEYPNGKPLFGEDCEKQGIMKPYYGNNNCRDTTGLLDSWDLHSNNSGDYGLCCTSYAWVGQALAIHLMRAEAAWNHPAYFDYVDRWTQTPSLWPDQSDDFKRATYGYGGFFIQKVWEEYRGLINDR